MTHHEDRQFNVLDDIAKALEAIKGELAMTREYMKVRDQRSDQGQILEDPAAFREAQRHKTTRGV